MGVVSPLPQLGHRLRSAAAHEDSSTWKNIQQMQQTISFMVGPALMILLVHLRHYSSTTAWRSYTDTAAMFHQHNVPAAGITSPRGKVRITPAPMAAAMFTLRK